MDASTASARRRAAGRRRSIGRLLLFLASTLSAPVTDATSAPSPSSLTSRPSAAFLPSLSLSAPSFSLSCPSAAFLPSAPTSAPSSRSSAAFLPSAATAVNRRRLSLAPLRMSSSSTTISSSSPPPTWDGLKGLVEAALASEGDGIGADAVDRGMGVGPGVSAADVALTEALQELKAAGAAARFNSARLEPYRASKADLAVYARMQEQLEVALGFTASASSAVERIETGIFVLMGMVILVSITSLDKLTGVVPDFVRWLISAGLVSLPFVWLGLGLALPDKIIAAVNQVLFAFNREYKERVYRHEAGHFLVGYLTGLPILKYAVSGRLSAVQFAQVLDMGSAAQPSGPLPREQADKMTSRGVLSKEELAKLAAVSLAGVVSEFIRFGRAQGGFEDFVQLQALLDLAGGMEDDKESQGLIRYAVIQAYTMIRGNEKALVALMAALEDKKGVVECMQIIEDLGGRYIDEDDD